MNKQEYIEMLCQDNETQREPIKTLYADVIDCVDISLSQMPSSFEIGNQLSLQDLYKLMENKARELHDTNDGVTSVGPFMAAELFANAFGAEYQRASRRITSQPVKRNLEDFFND